MNKQETLEEFIQTQLSLGKYQDQESAIRHLIELGAKWQQEQDKNKYSEEDMKEAFKVNYTPFSATNIGDFDEDFNRWFEKFKNK